MITEKYISFFHELENNNNKEWFHAKKKTYEEYVKQPFLLIVEELITNIMEFDHDISLNPKDTLFRINKDIRFSKDKTPYNTIMKAGIAPGGKKSVLPGYYLGISANTIYVGGGLFKLNSESLIKIRTYIFNNPQNLEKIIKNTSFVQYFKSLKGEQAKRLPSEFKSLLDQTPYIANKQFYAMEELQLEDHINSNEIVTAITHRFKAISDLNQFLKQALK